MDNLLDVAMRHADAQECRRLRRNEKKDQGAYSPKREPGLFTTIIRARRLTKVAIARKHWSLSTCS